MDDYHNVYRVLVAVDDPCPLQEGEPPACHPHAGTRYLGGSPSVAIEVFFSFHKAITAIRITGEAAAFGARAFIRTCGKRA